ncbi:MAG: HesA/MoeB/ThiF family protein [Tepidanaerobacteraceae bacterium]|nr:HesA/MoeB/ThiF family protein [Tepidanaerobacteraceae bacterium]
MTLSQNQTKRFSRHIIMPEISGSGQKKLLDSWVQVYASSVQEAMSLLYYLTAVGIGKISYNFTNNFGIEKIVNDLKDINPDITLEEFKHHNFKTDDNLRLRIIIGSQDFVYSNVLHFKKDKSLEVPLMTAILSPWQGSLHLLKKQEEIDSHILKLDSPINSSGKHLASQGLVLSSCLVGALAVTEVVKFCLNLGNSSYNPMFFDLMSMTFLRKENDDFNVIEDVKHFKPCKENLSDARVLIVGAGGLGSPAAFALASVGVGTLGLIDGDRVELTNLNRQILHATSRIGMPKVKSAKCFLKELNPSIEIVTYHTYLTKDNALDLVKDYDVIIAGLDNLPSRYLLNDACFFANKPLVEAGVLRFNGMGQTFVPKKGPCYRCIFAEIPSLGSIPSCSDSGVLGSVPGVMGFLEAIEAVKLLCGVGELLKNRLLLFDALDLEFRIPSFRRDLRCPLCGQDPSITSL